MEVLKTFRHEFKYTINRSEFLGIKSKLKDLIKVDRNINGYMVRSLYFDSVDDIDYNEKLAGTMNRKKIRLRIYEPDTDYVKLEIKNKYDVHQLKESLVINRYTAEELIKGNYEILLNLDNDVATKIYTIMRKHAYKPKVIIEYDRVAFMSNTTTRITLDYNLRKSNKIEDFFNKKINYKNLSNINQAVLEVKFDRFLEPYIYEILSKYVSNYESFSKYVMGRNI